MINIDQFGEIAAQAEEKFPGYAAHMRALAGPASRRWWRAAHEAGVPIYVGTDAGGGIGHGQAAEEMLLLHERAGMSTMDVLRAGSWGAREWLGFPGLVEGGLADLVVYDARPAARPDRAALAAPDRAAGLRALARYGSHAAAVSVRRDFCIDPGRMMCPNPPANYPTQPVAYPRPCLTPSPWRRPRLFRRPTQACPTVTRRRPCRVRVGPR